MSGLLSKQDEEDFLRRMAILFLEEVTRKLADEINSQFPETETTS